MRFKWILIYLFIGISNIASAQEQCVAQVESTGGNFDIDGFLKIGFDVDIKECDTGKCRVMFAYDVEYLNSQGKPIKTRGRATRTSNGEAFTFYVNKNEGLVCGTQLFQKPKSCEIRRVKIYPVRCVADQRKPGEVIKSGSDYDDEEN